MTIRDDGQSSINRESAATVEFEKQHAHNLHLLRLIRDEPAWALSRLLRLEQLEAERAVGDDTEDVDRVEARKTTPAALARRPLRWREGRHWQIDGKRLSAWVGVAGDRWMIGVIFNYESGTLGFGLGPIYAGVGV